MNKFQQLDSVLREKSVFITGGSGFFGKNLLDVFAYGNANLNWNSKVYTASRGALSNVRGSWHKHFCWDLQNKSSNDLPSKIDYIIHAASPLHDASSSNPLAMYESILESKRNILEYAHKSNAKTLIFTSSGAVYGPQPHDLPFLSETFYGAPPTTDRRYSYGCAKRAAETLGALYSSQHGFNYISARCFAFSGRYLPLDLHFAIGNFVSAVINRKPIVVKGDHRTLRSYMDAEDLCYWLLKMLNHNVQCDIFNVGSDLIVSIGELAKLVSSFGEDSSPVTYTSDPSVYFGKEISSYVPDISKAKRELGLALEIDIETSIKKMISFASAGR